MSLIPLMILFLAAFMLQYLFTFMQMKDFNRHYGSLRRMGRVAIGKVKGALRAGAIVMFAIDEEGPFWQEGTCRESPCWQGAGC